MSSEVLSKIVAEKWGGGKGTALKIFEVPIA
jgi:hypothetical protein